MHKISPLPVMTDTAMVHDQHTLNLNITAVSNPGNELSQSLNIRTDGKKHSCRQINQPSSSRTIWPLVT
ncbi:MAG: hypothetical protein DWH78_05545 [Planctomycetota bacterium]|nr:MAG: hypothetical protein DWH78_05545 [Planctomycetota bacterium]